MLPLFWKQELTATLAMASHRSKPSHVLTKLSSPLRHATNPSAFWPLCLLLHSGETDYNRQRIIQGQRDVELSDVGSNQAQLVAKRLASERFNLVFSSDLSRAKKVPVTLAFFVAAFFPLSPSSFLPPCNLAKWTLPPDPIRVTYNISKYNVYVLDGRCHRIKTET